MTRDLSDCVRAYPFDLTVHRTNSGYLARCRGSLRREEESSFINPFDPLEIENLWLKLGRAPRLRRVSKDLERLTESFGDRLFRAVFQDGLLRCLVACRSEAEQDQAVLLIRLGLRDAPELADLPWEFLYDRRARMPFLALSRKTPIVRYLRDPNPGRPLAVDPPLRMLVVTSEPPGYEAVDTDGEWEALADALQPAVEAGHILLDRLDRPDPRRLQQELEREPCHILHFVGHGGFSDRDQGGKLVFGPDDEQARLVSSQDLGRLLHGQESLRLVVLNTCEGARAAPSDAFSGTAQALVRQGVPAVLAMQAEVTDRTALELARQFYRNLAMGQPVDECLTRARVTIATHLESPEWGIPVLFLQSQSGRLFSIDPQDSNFEVPDPSAEPFQESEPTTPHAPPCIVRPQDELGRAQLSLRLQAFAPLAGGAEIDRTLVTGAEYQLFLNQVEGAHHPDHWLHEDCPEEALQRPVLGLRAQDALRFCEWLNQRPDSVGWSFRLPSAEEHHELPLGTPGPTAADDSLAIWCRGGGRPVLVESSPPVDSRCRNHLDLMAKGYQRRCLALVIHQHSPLANTLTYPRNPARDRHLEKAAVRAIEEVSPLQTMSFNLDPVGHLQRKLAIDSAAAQRLSFELGRTRGLARNLSRLRTEARVHDLGKVDPADLGRWRDSLATFFAETTPESPPTALERSLELVRDIGHDLRRAQALEALGPALDERSLAHDPALRDGARLATLVVAHRLSNEVTLAIPLVEPSRDPAPPENQAEVERALRLFWSLSMLDERLRGSHPPYEGLRLVRQRAESSVVDP